MSAKIKIRYPLQIATLTFAELERHTNCKLDEKDYFID